MVIPASDNLRVDAAGGANTPPADFIKYNGRAYVGTGIATPGNPIRLLPEDSRITLVIWGTTALITIIPDSEDTASLQGPQMAAGNAPLTISRAVHNQSVALGWAITTTAASASVTWIECRQEIDPSAVAQQRIDRIGRIQRRR